MYILLEALKPTTIYPLMEYKPARIIAIEDKSRGLWTLMWKHKTDYFSKHPFPVPKPQHNLTSVFDPKVTLAFLYFIINYKASVIPNIIFSSSRIANSIDCNLALRFDFQQDEIPFDIKLKICIKNIDTASVWFFFK